MDIAELRKTARANIERITANNPTICLPQGWLSKDIQMMSLASLVKGLSLSDPNADRQKSFETIVVLETYLSSQPDEAQISSGRDAATLLREWVASAILPSRAFAETSPYSMEEKQALTPDFVAKEHALSSMGLLLLSHLHEIVPVSSAKSSADLYTCLASFSDINDPWTPPEAREQAQLLVEGSADPKELPMVLHALLRQRVKPLFARSKSPAITQQGRKAIDPLAVNAMAHSERDVEAKPWKYRDIYIVTVFQWVVEHLDATSIEANWPLIIPPLLALLDDSSIQYKAKGCAYLSIFLQSCPSPLLERTGLGEVFENAVMPCLISLPSLTEEADSLHLLRSAYPALMSLARIRFADERQRDAKIKALDRILRCGVLKGYAHAGEHVRIAELLVNQMMELINEMGIASIKHLKHVFPVLSANLAAPFAIAYPPLLKASIKALKAAMVNDWPRITNHRGEILRGLTICWCRIKDEETLSKELRDVQESIEKSVHLLTLLIENDVDVAAEYQMLIDCDDGLRDVLIVRQSSSNIRTMLELP